MYKGEVPYPVPVPRFSLDLIEDGCLFLKNTQNFLCTILSLINNPVALWQFSEKNCQYLL